jgi:hypothetical protein
VPKRNIVVNERKNLKIRKALVYPLASCIMCVRITHCKLLCLCLRLILCNLIFNFFRAIALCMYVYKKVSSTSQFIIQREKIWVAYEWREGKVNDKMLWVHTCIFNSASRRALVNLRFFIITTLTFHFTLSGTECVMMEELISLDFSSSINVEKMLFFASFMYAAILCAK